MPKPLYLFTPFWLMALCVMAQSGIVTYNQVIREANDTTLYSKLAKQLIFNLQKTIYQTTKNRTIKSYGTNPNYVYKPNTPESRIGIVYKDFVLNTVSSVEPAMQERIFMRDTMTVIDWKIGTETKQLGELLCQRAEADVRGRHWTVWFTPKIPVSSGPWKSYGLPGLILEASDHTGNIKYLFESIQIPAPSDAVIETFEPASGQRVMNHRQFGKQLATNLENYIKMIDSDPNYPGIKTTMKIGSIEIYPEMEGK